MQNKKIIDLHITRTIIKNSLKQRKGNLCEISLYTAEAEFLLNVLGELIEIEEKKLKK